VPDREGPVLIQASHRSCSGCKWHEQHMLCSGQEPIYDHYCVHPKHPEVTSPFAMLFTRPGREIGRDDRTPRWCPVAPG
jgi:hypothetical protein